MERKKSILINFEFDVFSIGINNIFNAGFCPLNMNLKTSN